MEAAKELGLLAQALDYVPSLTVPVLYAQVKNDVYTFNQKTGQNDIQEIMDATLEHSTFGSAPIIRRWYSQRFDGFSISIRIQMRC